MPRWRTMIEPAVHELAVAGLDAEALADAVAAVLDAAARLLVCHLVYSSFFVARGFFGRGLRVGRRRRRPWRPAVFGAAGLGGGRLRGRPWPRVSAFAVASALAGLVVGLRRLRLGLAVALALALAAPRRRPRASRRARRPWRPGRAAASSRRWRSVFASSSAFLAGLGRALATEHDVGDAQDRQLLAMALLDAAARLGAVLERDELRRRGSGVTTSALTDASATSGRPIVDVVAVGDEQDALERDRLAGLDVEQLDLELRADLDAVLLPAGLDDCVHGSSGSACLATARGDRDVGHGMARGEGRGADREVYGSTHEWSIAGAWAVIRFGPSRH